MEGLDRPPAEELGRCGEETESLEMPPFGDMWKRTSRPACGGLNRSVGGCGTGSGRRRPYQK